MKTITSTSQVKLRSESYDRTTPLLLGTMILGTIVVAVLMFAGV